MTAPGETIPLCRLEDLEATGAKSVTIGTGPATREVVVVLGTDGAVRAYRNICPHLQISLETWPDKFLDEDRAHLVCTMHGARFRVDDGLCVWGPCEGQSLTPLSIEVAGDTVLLKPA